MTVIHLKKTEAARALLACADAANLPVKRSVKPRVNRRAMDRAATEAERNAIRFEAVKATFNWSNEEWAITWLPWVRAAVAALALDDQELTDSCRDFAEDGTYANALEGWARTKRHLQALVEGIDTAMARSFLALERNGYSPDNPPPELPAHKPGRA